MVKASGNGIVFGLSLCVALWSTACSDDETDECAIGGCSPPSAGSGGGSGYGGKGQAGSGGSAGRGGTGGSSGSGGGSGCEARPASDGQCGGSNPPHYYSCSNFEPSEPAAGCMLLGIGDLYDFYCCP